MYKGEMTVLFSIAGTFLIGLAFSLIGDERKRRRRKKEVELHYENMTPEEKKWHEDWEAEEKRRDEEMEAEIKKDAEQGKFLFDAPSEDLVEAYSYRAVFFETHHLTYTDPTEEEIEEMRKGPDVHWKSLKRRYNR